MYIGQSINLNKRKGRHFSNLRNNTHSNDYLQRSFNKYGEENFTFDIIEYCNIDELDSKEIYYIKEYDSMDINKGYNLESGGNATKTVAESTRQKKVGKNNPRYRVKVSEETKMKTSLSNRGINNILTEDDVVKIKELIIEGISQKKISEMFNVNHSTINKIATFKNWKYLREDLNEIIIKNKTKKNIA